MEFSLRYLGALLVLVFVVNAEYAIYQNTVYATAGTCAQQCAAYVWGYNYVMFGCNSNYIATCVCDESTGHSSSMDVMLSMCPQSTACGGDAAATQAMGIFSAYCSMNLKGVATTKASTARTSNPTTAATPASTGVLPQDTSVPTQTSSTSSNDSSSTNSSSSNSLSLSDKIAIGCAIGGAIVTIAVAVPTWIHMKKRKAASNAAEEQPLHPLPQMGNTGYYNHVQQPLFTQPQPRPQPYYWYRPNNWT